MSLRSAAVLPAAITPFKAGTTSGSTTWFGLLTRWLRPSSMSAAEEALFAELKRAARVLGAPLLEAESREDLNDRIELGSMSLEFQALGASAGRLLMLDAAPPTIPPEPPAEMSRMLGLGPAKIVTQGGRLLVALVSVLAQLVVEHGREILEVGDEPPAAIFARPGVHSTVKNAILQGMRSTIAFLGITHAVVEGIKPSPWLSLALAETYRDGLYDYLRLLASLPVNIPVSVVPMADRFDLSSLQRDVDEGEARLELLAGSAEELFLCEVPDDP